jgi:hypothetical protein
MRTKIVVPANKSDVVKSSFSLQQVNRNSLFNATNRSSGLCSQKPFQSGFQSTTPQQREATKNAERSNSEVISPPKLNFSFSNVSVLPATPAPIQAKLKVGQPDDEYEQEADRVAEMIMRMPGPNIQSKPT